MLHVGLAVQVLGFHVGHALELGTVEEDQICREVLFFVDFDDLADTERAPCCFLKLAGVRVGDQHFALVFLFIAISALNILK